MTVDYTERELILLAINRAKPAFVREPRWALVKRVFGTGRTVSIAICEKYGFDPDKELVPLAELTDKEYDELMQHGISK